MGRARVFWDARGRVGAGARSRGGLTKPLPSVVFVAALAASMLGLSHAVRTIPIGTAYAVWVGIGAAVTVGYGIATGAESFSWAKVVLLAGLVGCVVGLKIVGESH